MRQQLIRSTILAILIALLVVAGPLLVLSTIFAVRGPKGRADLVAYVMEPSRAVWWVLVTIVVSAIALAVGALIARRQADRLAAPIAELADRAERLAAGERFEPMASGIAEVDRVSETLSRRAQALTSSLAAERDFAADASHQLRTPLTAVLMRLDEIATTDDLEVVHDEAQIAIDQVERLTKTVDDLLARSRRGGRRLSSVSLDAVIASLQREFQATFEKARRSIHVSGERGLMVLATPVALSQILSTLLENSLQHAKGTVEMSARRSGPSVVIEVTDQGPGIAATIAPHIFERAVSSQGSGLGLTLARDLAEANGGRLELVSAQPAAVFALFLSEAPH